MATRTVVRMFDDREHALQAVRELERAGFTQDEVSLMAAGDIGTTATSASTGTSIGTTTAHETGSSADTGAAIGTILGGGAGLMAGIGAMAIPGLGPIVAAGWLVAVLTGAGAGAAAGGLLGSLVKSGVDETDAHTYAEGIRRGGTLVSVRGSESRVDEAEQILAGHPAVDVAARAADWRAGGWTGTSTATSRTPGHADSLADIAHRPDGAPGNPPGTEASRGVDRAVGTNISGAHPENETPRRG